MAHGNMTTEEIKKHVRGYYIVFAALLCLTAVTVGISYLHLPLLPAVILALAVAITKGSLVALYFMHLISEKTVIYAILGMTGFFFLCVMAVAFLL